MMTELAHDSAPLCSMCKQQVAAGRSWYRCSVSACNAGRLKLRFCSVRCFERHIPTARHRRASCIEEGAAAPAPAPAAAPAGS